MYKQAEITEEWFDELKDELKKAFKKVMYEKLPAIDNVVDFKLREPLVTISVENTENEIYPLFLWLKDGRELPEYGGEVVLSILSLVWGNPFFESDEIIIDWDLWAKKSKLGYLIRAVKFNERPER